jgi:hypothetical protein
LRAILREGIERFPVGCQQEPKTAEVLGTEKCRLMGP